MNRILKLVIPEIKNCTRSELYASIKEHITTSEKWVTMLEHKMCFMFLNYRPIKIDSYCICNPPLDRCIGFITKVEFNDTKEEIYVSCEPDEDIELSAIKPLMVIDKDYCNILYFIAEIKHDTK